MEVHTYNLKFKAHLTRLKEIDCELPDAALAHLYLKKGRFGSDTRRMILNGAGNAYSYEKLARLAMAPHPQGQGPGEDRLGGAEHWSGEPPSSSSSSFRAR